ncbi:hypothetical protein V5799_017380 [Amblyomma americanum]|uniref:Uncharacterized protein n=1 Tax=Amblyomma americanum TaxID=6943 RepID=A0AAQ4F3F4_AMBAM
MDVSASQPGKETDESDHKDASVDQNSGRVRPLEADAESTDGPPQQPAPNATNGKPTSTAVSDPQDVPADTALESAPMDRHTSASRPHQAPELDERAASTQYPLTADTTQRPPARHSHLSDQQEKPGASCRSSPHIHVEERSENRALLSCGFVGTVLVVAALFLLVVRRGHDQRHETLVVCDTEDCAEHAKSILATLNESADPCVDFHAHVCGGGRIDSVSAPPDTLARAYSREVMNTLGNPKAFLNTKRISMAAVKAFTNVVYCMSRKEETAPVNITEFMQARGIPWPFADASAAGERGPLAVLNVLLDLAVNWRVGLWFEVTVSQTAADDSSAIVVIGEPGHLPLLRMEQLEDIEDEAYYYLARNVSRVSL